MYGVGGLVGPSATGAVMDAIGSNGLPLSLGFLGFVLAVFAFGSVRISV
jgi:hypothetical protein